MESVRGNAWVSARLPSGSLARLEVTQDTCGFFCSRTSVRRVGPTTALCGTYLGRLSLLNRRDEWQESRLVKAYSWRLRSHVGAMPPTKKPRARKSNPGCAQRVQHDGAGGLPFPTRLHRSECARTFQRGAGPPS